MVALKKAKWIIAWKKIDFADLVKDAKSATGFSPSRQFLIGRKKRVAVVERLPL